MSLACPSCNSTTIKKNGHIYSGKQNHQCLSCGRQFVLNPEKKSIPEEERVKIRQALLERVSLEGICRIFNVSMPWLLRFMDEIIHELSENLNANVIENEELEIATIELDEQWSYVGKKKNPQWLWLVFHSATRQVLAMHVGKRDKASAECLLAKLPEDIKKKPSFIQINSQCITKLFLGFNIVLSVKSRVKRATLKDLITPLDKDVLGS
ncbi:putative transposase [Chlamydiales bacterium STE3]|nr:putative transposase [Chlamydiales bacterium STE3]